MVLKTVRSGADVVVRRNEVFNPSVEFDTTGWLYSWFGTGAGTNQRLGDGGLQGTGYMRKTFTANASDSADIGFGYRHDGWSGTYVQKTASAYLRPVGVDGYGRVSLLCYNGSGGLISRQDGAATYLGNSVWTRVSGTFSCSPGTAYAYAQFWLTGGRSISSSFRLDLDCAQIEPGSTLSTYIDGDTWAGGNGNQYTRWAGQSHNSQSLVYAPDPALTVLPTMVLGYDDTTPSRNIVHQLIDGGTAQTLLSAGGRQGVLRMLFPSAADAEAARLRHAGVGTWQLTDDDQPQQAMKYVVNGAARKYQSDSRKTWLLEVPFQEVS